MQARPINPFEYAEAITKANPKGILFTTKAEGKVDTMVIGWGQIGTLWGKPTFTAFVRTSRESHRLVELNPQFTINVPADGRLRKDIFALAGAKSGRDHDKIAELGLTLVDGHEIDVPAIAEAPLTLECKVVYSDELDKAKMPAEVRATYYPDEITDIDTGGNCYTHVAFYGEIVDAYLLED